MTHGIRVWHNDGTINLDVTDRVLRFVSYHSGASVPTSGLNVTVPGWVNNNTWEAVGVFGMITVSRTASGFRLTRYDPSLSIPWGVIAFRV